MAPSIIILLFLRAKLSIFARGLIFAMKWNLMEKNDFFAGFTFALRTLGPVVGFALGYACLSLYIDPTLHPLITKEDPRWLGAWWLGWIILGTTMGMFAVFIAMFPRHLPKPGKSFHQVK